MKRRALQRQSEDLAEQVIQLLIEQNDRYVAGLEEQASISIPQMRDFMLPPSQFRNGKDRAWLWNAVKQLIAQNASIRETYVLLKGEQFDAWQWIGSSVLGSERRKSGAHRQPSVEVGPSPSREPPKPLNEPFEATMKLYPSLK